MSIILRYEGYEDISIILRYEDMKAKNLQKRKRNWVCLGRTSALPMELKFYEKIVIC